VSNISSYLSNFKRRYLVLDMKLRLVL